MTLIDVICAVAILSLFFFGFSQVFLPVHKAWNNAISDYRTVKTINFVAESFKNECTKRNRNMENWERQVLTAKELESIEISEIRKDMALCALKLICVISGIRIEVIGVCTP